MSDSMVLYTNSKISLSLKGKFLVVLLGESIEILLTIEESVQFLNTLYRILELAEDRFPNFRFEESYGSRTSGIHTFVFYSDMKVFAQNANLPTRVAIDSSLGTYEFSLLRSQLIDIINALATTLLESYDITRYIAPGIRISLTSTGNYRLMILNEPENGNRLEYAVLLLSFEHLSTLKDCFIEHTILLEDSTKNSNEFTLISDIKTANITVLTGDIFIAITNHLEKLSVGICFAPWDKDNFDICFSRQEVLSIVKFIEERLLEDAGPRK